MEQDVVSGISVPEHGRYTCPGENKHGISKAKKWMGLLQGFSKEGWADEYEVKYTKDGAFDYVLIKKLIFASLSIVSTPANSLRFDKIGETANIINSTKFVNKNIPAKEADILDELFN